MHNFARIKQIVINENIFSALLNSSKYQNEKSWINYFACIFRSFFILFLFVFGEVDFVAMKNITMKIIITIPTFEKRLFHDVLLRTNHVLDTANTNSRLQYYTSLRYRFCNTSLWYRFCFVSDAGWTLKITDCFCSLQSSLTYLQTRANQNVSQYA